MKGKKRDYREDLMDEAVDRSEGSFSKGTRVLTNLPEGYEFVKLQKGNNLLDIIPFEIKSSNYPKKDKGRIAYHLFINVHRFVGPGEQHNFVCLTQYGKKCPVCEFLQANKSKLSEDEAKKLKPKQRVYYNVIVLTDNIKNKKISLLESSYFEFESKLKEEFQYKLNENNGIVPFSDPEEGLSVMVRGSERVFLGRTSIEPKKFDFVERKNQHSENIIDEAVSFDEFLNVLSYEEMFSLFHGVGEIEDVEEDDDDSEEEDAEVDLDGFM